MGGTTPTTRSGTGHRARRPLLLGLSVALFSLQPLVAAAPVIDSFTAVPPAVAPGDTVTLTVAAHDPDCPGTCTTGCGLTIRADLTLWTAGSGTYLSQDNGVTGSPYTASAVWQAPAAEGTYTLGVSLSDSGTFVCGGRQTTTADLLVQVTLSTNQPPVIDSLTASPVQLLTGQPSNLTCSASDPEGDPISYSWSSGAGTVTATGPGQAVFVGDAPGLAGVTCTATDTGGGFGAATVQLSVTDALAEKSISSVLVNPQRLAVDSLGDLYVVDRRAGGLLVVNLFSGELVYRLPLPDVVSVAVDWQDHLLVGRSGGAQVVDRRGNLLLPLPGLPAGEIADVAVDLAGRRYGVLLGRSARVVIYGETGGVVANFGAPGDGPGELKTPSGLAFTPAGEIAVADAGHGVIKIFDPSGSSLLRTLGALGGGAGEFVRLDDVTVAADGVLFATDSFQDWVQSFNPDGSLREVLGNYGDGSGELKTPTGIVTAEAFDRLVVASLNSSRLQVFRMQANLPPEPAPAAVLSPTSLAFVRQAVGTTSRPRTATLTNTGDAPLGVRRVEVSGDFAQSHGCGPFLDPGASCTFAVTFTPTAPGLRNGSLALDTSLPGAPLVVSLTGDGFVVPGLALAPGEVQFPDQLVGTTSEPRTVALSNTGTLPLTVTRIATVGEFAQGNGCIGTLPAGGRCEVSVTFTPQRIADSIVGRLEVFSNAAGGPHVVRLEGRGTAIDLTPLPGQLDFGALPVEQVTEPRSLAVINTGTLPIQIGTVALVGEHPEAYAVAEDECSGRRLFGAQSCRLAVRFAPGQEGTLAAALAVPSDTTLGPDFVELAGTGLRQGVLEIPTLSQWGLLLLALLLAAIGAVTLRGRFHP